MIDKYTTKLAIQSDLDKKRHYSTVMPSPIPMDTFRVSIKTRAGDRFDSIATRYYKDATKWWIIAKANNMVNGSIFIPAGTTIIIPSAGL